MTDNLSLFSNFTPISSLSLVTVANGTRTLFHGIGSVHASNHTFSSVLYLPQFPFNLLSVRKLTHSLNCSVTFFPTHCIFQDLKTKRMIGGGFEKDGPYYLQPSSP